MNQVENSASMRARNENSSVTERYVAEEETAVHGQRGHIEAVARGQEPGEVGATLLRGREGLKVERRKRRNLANHPDTRKGVGGEVVLPADVANVRGEFRDEL